MAQFDKWIEEARRLGRERGGAARIEAFTVADDVVPDADNVPEWLSGEWAGDPTPRSLMYEVAGDDGCDCPDGIACGCHKFEYCSPESMAWETGIDDVCRAYEDAATAAYLGEVE